MLSRYNRLGVLLFCVICALSSVAFWAALRSDYHIFDDSANASVVARNLSHGHGYVVNYMNHYLVTHASVWHVEDYWPLLHPTYLAAFLLVFGDASWPIALGNVLLYALVGGLTWWGARRMHVSPIGAFLAALIFLLAPTEMYRAPLSLSDTLLALLILASLLFAVHALSIRRPRSLCALGFAIGVTFLAKPTGIVVYAAASAYLALNALHLRPRVAQQWALMTVGFLLAAGPYFGYNLANFGTMMPPAASRIFRVALPQEKLGWTSYTQVHAPPGTPLIGDTTMSQMLVSIAFNLKSMVNSVVMGGAPQSAVFLAMGLLGMSVARGRARILSRLGLFTLLFTIPLMTIHFEARYVLFWVPLLGIFTGFLLDRWTAAFGPGPGKAMIAALLAVLLCGFYGTFVDTVRAARSHREYIAISSRVLEVVPNRASVVMTLYPPELTFRTRLSAVKAPYASLDGILSVAAQFGAEYLLIDENTRKLHPAYEELVAHWEKLGYTRISDGNDPWFLLLKFPPVTGDRSPRGLAGHDKQRAARGQ